MPTNDDIEQLLKKYRKPADPKKPEIDLPPPAAPRTLPTSSAAPAAHDTWLDRANKWGDEADTGILKRFAGAATGIPRAINAGIGLVAPSLSAKMGDLAEQVPGVKRMQEFAAEPSQSWPETIGGLGGLAVMGGVPKAAAAPAVYAGGGKFIPGMAPPISRTAKLAEATARGAAAGAATDPDSPGTGAIVGGATAGLAPVAGQVMRSSAGQAAIGHAVRTIPAGIATGLASHFGLPKEWLLGVGLPALVQTYHSQSGTKIADVGKAAARKIGRKLQRLPSTAVGAGAGEAASAGGMTGIMERAGGLEDQWFGDSEPEPTPTPFVPLGETLRQVRQ